MPTSSTCRRYAEKDLGKPVLGAGTLAMITKDSDAARAFIEFLKMPLTHELWMAQSGFVTPHKGVNVDAYANDELKKQGEILADATTFRFDGSDLMPGKIGAGSFWTGMVELVGGKPAEQVATEIQTELGRDQVSGGAPSPKTYVRAEFGPDPDKSTPSDYGPEPAATAVQIPAYRGRIAMTGQISLRDSD
jgi:hypothetical protein